MLDVVNFEYCIGSRPCQMISFSRGRLFVPLLDIQSEALIASVKLGSELRHGCLQLADTSRLPNF